MEIMDDVKGILKATGAQIKTRIMGGEQAATVAENALPEKECSKENVSANSGSLAQSEEASQSASKDNNKGSNHFNPVIDRVFQLR